jgi:hypothetical protein
MPSIIFLCALTRHHPVSGADRIRVSEKVRIAA